MPVTQEEPLRLELEAFFESVASRRPPLVTGAQGLAALEVASGILDRIEEHSRLVAKALEPQASQTQASQRGKCRARQLESCDRIFSDPVCAVRETSRAMPSVP